MIKQKISGNEEDFIILSLVRTKDLGFLRNRRRNNVMLTRCKKGMFICTSAKFLEQKAQETIVGRLLEYCGDNWVGPDDIEELITQF